MTKLRQDWYTLMRHYVGYRLVEDEDVLRSFNAGIKRIIQKERGKWIKKLSEGKKWGDER